MRLLRLCPLLFIVTIPILAQAQYSNASCPPNFQTYPGTCAPFLGPADTNTPFPPISPSDYGVIGAPLQAVHSSTSPPTGLAIDPSLNIYLTYPRNSGPTPNNVVICQTYTTEEPWPNASIQNCSSGQNASECFINVQNVVLDSLNQMWVVDSGIPAGGAGPVKGGAKIMSFNTTTRQHLRTYTIPEALFYDRLNLNDLRINNTLGTGGYAFIPDATTVGSLLTIDLSTGDVQRRLYNDTSTRTDDKFVAFYNGEPVYSWNGTKKSYSALPGSDGIALQSGNVYWGVLASRRFYYIPQAVLVDPNKTDDEVRRAVVYPSQCGSEQAGFTADDKGRVYITASEHNAILYIDTDQSRVTEEVNGTPPGGHGLVKPEDYVAKTLVRSALVQHADSAAIWDGWMYFCTNQLQLAPSRQYGNVDRRKGPFVSYRVWVGAGPAV